MNVLVTGANGFVGAAVTRALVGRGHEVSVLVRNGADLSNLAGLPVDLRFGDVRDRESVEAATTHCNVVFHVAADYRLWVARPQEMYATNVDGTRNVIDAALRANVDRIVYTSSVAALGASADDSATDEEAPAVESDMVGHYKRSKFLAERAAIEMVATRDAPVIIVNPSTPLGPGDVRPTPTGRIVLDAMRGRIPAFVDTGLNVVHVDDVAAGHVAAMEKGEIGRRYILGGDDLSLRQILTQVAETVGRRPPTVAIPHGVAMLIARGAEAMARVTGSEPRATVDGVRMSRNKMFYSSKRAATELGYRWRPASDAIEAAVAWFSSERQVST